MRAYAGYPKALKGIFHPRRLHVGHVANSFALREPPKAVVGLARKAGKKQHDKQQGKAAGRSKEHQDAGLDEDDDDDSGAAGGKHAGVKRKHSKALGTRVAGSQRFSKAGGGGGQPMQKKRRVDVVSEFAAG